MSKIENVKTYLGKELENLFFRPMVAGEDAVELGIRVMYNMPVPTTLHFWKRAGDVLHQYKNAGWNGSASAERFTKTIQLQRVKAEVGYSADEYFSLVCDGLTKGAVAGLDDLSGTELEAAETNLFKQAITESVRATMWLGKSTRATGLNTFDGFIHRILADVAAKVQIPSFLYTAIDATTVEERLNKAWKDSSAMLKDLKSEDQLAFFVTSDVYQAYEDSLEKPSLEAAYLAKQNGHEGLSYRGIPLVDVKVGSYLATTSDLTSSFILLTDRRNLALALNTADFPGTEVRMWYNPDLMENRQRAIFMAGCDYLLPELISFGYVAKA